jgi:hypothetical protein
MKQNDKTSCNCFKWDREGVVIQNWYNKSPLYNEYMLIKMKRNKGPSQRPIAYRRAQETLSLNTSNNLSSFP